MKITFKNLQNVCSETEIKAVNRGAISDYVNDFFDENNECIFVCFLRHAGDTESVLISSVYEDIFDFFELTFQYGNVDKINFCLNAFNSWNDAINFIKSLKKEI
jgi:hypothetical protein